MIHLDLRYNELIRSRLRKARTLPTKYVDSPYIHGSFCLTSFVPSINKIPKL